jgi:oxygen-independent coproporphyrinogen-3 oxidase
MSEVLKVDLDLVKKYNVPGPRYTSYPPATHFTEDVTRDQILEKIQRNNQGAKDLSLYFHLPFCESLCWFCGCTTVITTQHGKSKVYLEYLRKEMDLMGRYMNPDRTVEQIHLGGGTPTFFAPDEIRELGDMVQSRYKISNTVEAGVEIGPRRCDRDKLVALRDAGFNRSSIGVQDNNPVVQKAVHRIQPYEMTRQVVEWIREVGFESLNIDLIYGLSDLEADGLVIKTPQGIEITGVGRLLIRVIAMRFDPYLQAKQSEGKYSKVI